MNLRQRRRFGMSGFRTWARMGQNQISPGNQPSNQTPPDHGANPVGERGGFASPVGEGDPGKLERNDDQTTR